MKKILILKLASLGDLVHALPALSDAKRAHPDFVFDWALDHRFQEVASWHPAIRQVIPTNHRTWRKHPFSSKTRQEIGRVLTTLQESHYDLIIDAQGNWKTALFSLWIPGTTIGWDGSCIPEWGAHLFYGKTVSVPSSCHAIEKMRQLFAKALDDPLPTSAPDYQINQELFSPPPILLPSRYLVFVPIASTHQKLWPQDHWKYLLQRACEQNLSIVIPWGSEEEKRRMEQLILHPNITLLPSLSLSQIGYVLHKAQAIVSVDTGLSHIGAALNIPSITLYGPTDPHKTGTVGTHQHWLSSPSSSLADIHPSSVWKALQSLLG